MIFTLDYLVWRIFFTIPKEEGILSVVFWAVLLIAECVGLLEMAVHFYNMYDYGGILIYNNIKVFVDGRADLYSKYNYKDYLNISALKGDYPKLIDKYDFDYLLVSDKQQLSTYLKYSDKYELVYKNKDKGFVLYKTIEK